jgi:hypothetical protein
VKRSLGDGPHESTPASNAVSSVWRKSTRSIGNGQCIEAAKLADGRLAMRDSTDTTGPAIPFAEAAWHLFLKRVKADQIGIA